LLHNKIDLQTTGYKYNTALDYCYDPVIGRVLNPDNFVQNANNAQNYNRYSYCLNNPLKYADPNGWLLTDYYDENGIHLLHVNDGIDEAIVMSRMVFNALNEDDQLSNMLAKKLGGVSLGTNTEFNELAGTLYVEGDAYSESFEELVGIFSVMKNRANADDVSVYEVASNMNTYGIYGWKDRSKINSTLANFERVTLSHKAVIVGLTSNIDYSDGGYYWHGRDLAKPTLGSRAYEDYYLVGFKFSSSTHDLWNLGNNKSGNTSWDYKYESTGAAGRTTFMRLTLDWQKSVRSTKWNGR
jgi:RHS repeat-associated protein